MGLLQELSDLLGGGKGYIRLKNLKKMLRVRQQHMVSQVSLLYPVKITAGPTQEQELESFPSSSKSGTCYFACLAFYRTFLFKLLLILHQYH